MAIVVFNSESGRFAFANFRVAKKTAETIGADLMKISDVRLGSLKGHRRLVVVGGDGSVEQVCNEADEGSFVEIVSRGTMNKIGSTLKSSGNVVTLEELRGDWKKILERSKKLRMGQIGGERLELARERKKDVSEKNPGPFTFRTNCQRGLGAIFAWAWEQNRNEKNKSKFLAPAYAAAAAAGFLRNRGAPSMEFYYVNPWMGSGSDWWGKELKHGEVVRLKFEAPDAVLLFNKFALFKFLTEHHLPFNSINVQRDYASEFGFYANKHLDRLSFDGESVIADGAVWIDGLQKQVNAFVLPVW